MIKRIISFVLACFIISLCSITAFAETKEYQKEIEVSTPKNMLVLGDSIATGFRLANYKSGDNYNTASYSNMLAKDYKITAKKDYINLAIDGQTSSELLARLKSNNFDNDIKKADLILVSIGGNDLLGAFLTFVSSLAQIENITAPNDINNFDFSNPDILSNLNQMINSISENISDLRGTLIDMVNIIKDNNKNAKIIFQTVYNPFDTITVPEVLNNLIVNKIKDMNDIIVSASKGEGSEKRYEVCDVFTAFMGKSDVYTNIPELDIHPNASGHKIIEQELEKVISNMTFHTTITASKEFETKDESISDKKVNGDTNVLDFVIPIVAVMLVGVIIIIVYIIRRVKREK